MEYGTIVVLDPVCRGQGQRDPLGNEECLVEGDWERLLSRRCQKRRQGGSEFEIVSCVGDSSDLAKTDSDRDMGILELVSALRRRIEATQQVVGFDVGLIEDLQPYDSLDRPALGHAGSVA